MSYCTPEDVRQVIPQLTLTELTHDPVEMDLGQALPSQPDMAIISRAVEYADELIDAHLRGRYTLPLASTPTVVRDLAINLVWYRLYQRRPDRDLPEAIKETYRGTLRTLEGIRDGKLTLGVQATQADLPESGEIRVRGPRARFGGPGGLLEKY